MVAGATFTLCLLCLSLAAANIEFKHHNNTELAAILQQVSVPTREEDSMLVVSEGKGKSHKNCDSCLLFLKEKESFHFMQYYTFSFERRQ